MQELPADRDEAIRLMRRNRDAIRRAQALDLQLAAHIADLYSELDDDPTFMLPGTERLVQVGSDGTPEVAEFCTLEICSYLGVTNDHVEALMSDAMDVRHRLPQLWRLLDEGAVPVWQARELASISRLLPHDACLELDRRFSPVIFGMSWKKTHELARALVLELLDPDEADAERERALERRRVDIRESENGVSHVDGWLDAGDAILLDGQLNRVAGILREGGQRGTHDALRAISLGVLANPGRALQALQADLMDHLPEDPDEFEDCIRAGQPGHACGMITIDPDLLLPTAELVVHLTDTTLAGGDGPARVEKVGPMLAQWAAEMLRNHRVGVRPVEDANRTAASDAYEAPDRLRQAVQLRNPHEVFPWSTRSSARCDLDHTAPYYPGGPPGQTRLENLGPLTRFVHRAKTHGGWKLDQPESGLFVWTSPLGHRYLVARSHTIALDAPEEVVPLVA